MSLYDPLIGQWMDDRGITDNGNALTQSIKTLEEVTELIDALNKNDKAEVMDAVGDIYVTLIGVCKTYKLDIQECIAGAYNEIKDRKGHLTPEGMFVKE
jgi:NTP pyrophosphatase (non-canonical NTP hydrolase)